MSVSDTHDGDARDEVEDDIVEPVGPRVFSGFGVASAALGLLCVAAVVLASLIWSSHSEQRAERDHKTRVVQTAVNWAGVLINMNRDNIDASVEKLHDETVGKLNTNLDATLAPLTAIIKKVDLKTTGRIDAVALESVYRDLNREPGTPGPDPTLGGLASRTDTVLIIATKVAETKGGPLPQTSLNLRIGVSDIGGQLMISALEILR